MKKTKVNATKEEVQNITDFFIFRKIGSRKSNIEQGLSDEQFNSSYNFVKDTIASIEKFLIQKDGILKIIFCVIFIEEVIMFKSEDEDEIVECIEYDCQFALLENNHLSYLDKDSEIKL